MSFALGHVLGAQACLQPGQLLPPLSERAECLLQESEQSQSDTQDFLSTHLLLGPWPWLRSQQGQSKVSSKRR
ncbi:hypothetical protein K435DRAFT_858383 [Dendrothele bispora CBS 962.96]|uniref:Uncharacterized protein n=1 Tax=Dendrothele bispora (strain CBS 962.96) TaxID=1314807 RepID=A0A4S8M382_DENBC|nr:hypothetical protein K435DRAFT_858383 [Dendrothele bispora CBS 962.96]